MDTLSLYQLNELVREAIEETCCDLYWVRAEVSECRLSAKGHCFLELVDKEEDSDSIQARARAIIMSYRFPLLIENFEETTGRTLEAGMKILVQVSISFSELYGYSLIVNDIDPTFTLGSIAQQRQQTIQKLKDSGVADMNKELPLPCPLQRIAIISSATAAGYGDFCKQLENNASNYRFQLRLFPAVMQGESTEASIINALDNIAEEMEDWDAVVIIRGGGAVSDLSAFDSYNLAFNCAQFPLPILTGIGHERDNSVLDFVAHLALKTPTAVAAFLIDQMDQTARELEALDVRLQDICTQIVQDEKRNLQQMQQMLDYFCKNFKRQQTEQLSRLEEKLREKIAHKLSISSLQLQFISQSIQRAIGRKLSDERYRLQIIESKLQAEDPKRILKRGYSITLRQGKVVREASQLSKGEEITTLLYKGKIKSIIK